MFTIVVVLLVRLNAQAGPSNFTKKADADPAIKVPLSCYYVISQLESDSAALLIARLVNNINNNNYIKSTAGLIFRAPDMVHMKKCAGTPVFFCLNR